MRVAASPIKHVIYIIKENRTYDQVLRRSEQRWQAGWQWRSFADDVWRAITPNQHKLALQFGVLDNFFDSGEVSGDGHVWSNAAIGTDYLEKTWQQNYRGGQRTYDYEGMVADGYPLLQHIPDVAEPPSGYIWTNLRRMARRSITLRSTSRRCSATAKKSAEEGRRIRSRERCRAAKQCARACDQAGRTDSGGVGRRDEPLAVGDSAAGQ